jgi:hypothetical protein
MRHSLLLLPLLFAACTNERAPVHTEASTNDTMRYIPLQDTLDARKTAFEKKADAGTKRDYAEGIDAVRASGILEAARQVGDTAHIGARLPLPELCACLP